MPRRRVALVLLACTLVAATGLRVAAGAGKPGLTHDEAISYLAAACHQGEYARLTLAKRPPYGRWAPASEWKDLLRPERTLCLDTIGTDLAREDIHPPLYFWLLHGWALVFGVGLWTGPSLNIVLAALTALALFGLARRALGDPLRGALVAFVWSFSPAAIRVFAEARQYELLALLATLFMWQCIRVTDAVPRAHRRQLVTLALLTAVGALSQFLFVLVVAAGLAFVLLARSRRTAPRHAVGALGAVAAGYLAFALLHPGFPESLVRAREQATAPSLALLAARLDMTARTVAEFLLAPELARGALAAVAMVALTAATVWLVFGPIRREEGETPQARALVLAFVWLMAGNAALFLAFLSPPSAMDYKHLSAVWPFAAFVPVLALARLPGRRRVTLAIACSVALVAMGAAAALGHHASRPASASLERADSLVLDNVARGVLPRVVWRVPDDASVFAADQSDLLATAGAWLPRLASRNLLVLGIAPSDPRYGNSPQLARRVAGKVARRYRLRPVPDPLEPGHVFRVGTPVAGP